MCELCKTAGALGSSEHPFDNEELARESSLSHTRSKPSSVCKKPSFFAGFMLEASPRLIVIITITR